MCKLVMCRASSKSRSGSRTSLTRKIMSKRERMVVSKSIWSAVLWRSSYVPKRGLAAASTLHWVFNIVVIPAFAIEMVCCSIASWIATRSFSSILSNSSMHTMPPSASTMAPPSRLKPPPGEDTMLAVRPAALEPLPLVYTATGATFSANLRNWLLAVPGSPSSSMLLSPLMRVPSGSRLRAPPKSMQATPLLTLPMTSFELSQMEGAMDFTIFSRMSGSFARFENFSSSSGDMSIP
mmetsp:Transcript_29921/g.85489  ORF Transcript_29921/g.85489 Transcript_29921/m.85489 type:complete len:237 (-) Transcript_29921:620-1330(-)